MVGRGLPYNKKTADSVRRWSLDKKEEKRRGTGIFLDLSIDRGYLLESAALEESRAR